MSTVNKIRVVQEGNYGFKVAALNSDGTYGALTAIDGLVSVDITFNSSVTNIAADDITDYLVRETPLTGEGTITLIGISKADYQKLFNNIVDNNGVVTFGRRAQSKKVGVVFFNTESYKYVESGVEKTGSSENMYTINSVIFQLPNLSTQTIQEDNSEVPPIEMAVKVSTYTYDKASGAGKDTVTYTILNSVDDATIYETVKTSGNVYVPDTTITPQQL